MRPWSHPFSLRVRGPYVLWNPILCASLVLKQPKREVSLPGLVLKRGGFRTDPIDGTRDPMKFQTSEGCQLTFHVLPPSCSFFDLFYLDCREVFHQASFHLRMWMSSTWNTADGFFRMIKTPVVFSLRCWKSSLICRG